MQSRHMEVDGIDEWIPETVPEGELLRDSKQTKGSQHERQRLKVNGSAKAR
jgi:hypothetical protein